MTHSGVSLAAVLRLLSPEIEQDLQLAPGRVLAGRVVAEQTQAAKGRLAIAGTVLDAELPEDLKAGQQIRLQVGEVSHQRVTLKLLSESPEVPPSTPSAVPLPGGGQLRVAEGEADSPDAQAPGSTTSLHLRYDAPNLGAMDLRFTLTPGGLVVQVHGQPGSGLELMRSELDGLRSTLQADQGTPVAVSVQARRDPVELYV
jgi:hypothetical protein